ncbi:MAG: type IV secretion system protein [Sphingobacteriia bacterium]|nr:type IV secretion system protein [Sphingobacteriia bacterium]
MIDILQLCSDFISVLPNTIENTYNGLGASFRILYGLIVIGFITYYGLWNKGAVKLDPVGIIYLSITIPLVLVIMVNGKLFVSYVYEPLQSIMEKLPRYILSSVTENSNNIYDEIQNISKKIDRLVTIITSESNSFIFNITFTVIQAVILSWILKFFICLMVIYTAFILIVGNVASAVLFMSAPITIPLAVFPETRSYFKNMIKGYFHFNLPVCFATAIIAICIKAMKGKIAEVDLLIESQEFTSDNIDFLISVIGYAAVSVYLMKFSYQFSDMILSGNNSHNVDRGGVIMSAFAGGMGTKAITSISQKGLSKIQTPIKEGLKSAGGFAYAQGMNFVSNQAQNIASSFKPQSAAANQKPAEPQPSKDPFK